MSFLPEKYELVGQHFIADISLKSKDEKTGLDLTETDPRQLRKKPEAYIGTVLEIGPACSKIKVGDRVIFERMSWLQMDIDDKRIIASEDQVLILGDGNPAEGCDVGVILKYHIPSRVIMTGLNLEKVEEPETQYVHAVITASPSGLFKKSQEVWLAKYDRNQWNLQGKIIFREDDDYMLMKTKD